MKNVFYFNWRQFFPQADGFDRKLHEQQFFQYEEKKIQMNEQKLF